MRSRVLTISLPKYKRRNRKVYNHQLPCDRIRRNRRYVYSYKLGNRRYTIDIVDADAFPEEAPFVRFSEVQKRIAITDNIPQKFRRSLCLLEVITHTVTHERHNPTLGAIAHIISQELPLKRQALWNYLKDYIGQLKEYYSADENCEDRYRQNLTQALHFLEQKTPPNYTI
ncbi:MAG: hypothetical protein HYZ62_01380 [Candidatus Andersenbacteria bacterium]|nr:hypothetical protein [Candidatus Andersenbacteria bacterium]